MSLFESILGEDLTRVPLPRKEVWIALRTDSVPEPPAPEDDPDFAEYYDYYGSQENPYDGSTVTGFDNVMRA